MEKDYIEFLENILKKDQAHAGILFIYFWIDLVRVSATTRNASPAAVYPRV